MNLKFGSKFNCDFINDGCLAIPRMSYGTISSQFSIKICVSNIEKHFLILIFGTSTMT